MQVVHLFLFSHHASLSKLVTSNAASYVLASHASLPVEHLAALDWKLAYQRAIADLGSSASSQQTTFAFSQTELSAHLSRRSGSAAAGKSMHILGWDVIERVRQYSRSVKKALSWRFFSEGRKQERLELGI